MGEPVRFGFVGPSYTSQSPTLDAQLAMNLYVEQDESGAGNAPLVLYSTPGTKLCVDLGGGGGTDKPTRGSITITGRTFFVSGTKFYEVTSSCGEIDWGTVANNALPVSMAASPQQLLIASAGTAYVFDLLANTLTAIPGATFSGPVNQCGICDDFFIVTIVDSKEFVVSAPLDATDWVTNGSAIVSVFPDNIIGMIVSHRQIVFGSDTKTVWYYDSGNVFPFDVIPGSDMDQGIAAAFSYSLLGNTILWLGADDELFAINNRDNEKVIADTTLIDRSLVCCAGDGCQGIGQQIEYVSGASRRNEQLLWRRRHADG